MKLTSEKDQFTDMFHCLDICCRQVAETYGRLDFAAWSNLDYIKLSGQLYRKTSVQISPSTLKRVYGKIKTPERYFPQSATRDALAQFAGHTDWDDLVSKSAKENMVPVAMPGMEMVLLNEEPYPSTIQTISITSAKTRSKKYWIPVLLIVAVAIGWYFLKPEPQVNIPPGSVRLQCQNARGESPHSAFFMISRQGNQPMDDKGFSVVFGDQKDGHNFTAGNQFSHYYEKPGRYYAVLKYRNQPLDTAVIYLTTPNWTAVASMERDTTRVYPIDRGKIIAGGKMMVSASDLHNSGVDTNHTFFVEFSNIRPLDIDGDNFDLSASLQTSMPRSGVRCSQVRITLFGEKAKISTMYIMPGCVSWANAIYSEIHKDGAAEVLNYMGADLREGGNIRIRVIDKKLSLFVHDSLVHQLAYKFPLEKIYGVQFHFAGIGTVNSYSLEDLVSGKTISEDFSGKE